MSSQFPRHRLKSRGDRPFDELRALLLRSGEPVEPQVALVQLGVRHVKYLPWLDPGGPPEFPPPESALRDPDGLLAAGGALTSDWLLAAYRSGIFPWYSEGEPILWWSPDPRWVVAPEKLRVPRSLRAVIRKGVFEVAFDRDFEAVIRGCAERPKPAPRRSPVGRPAKSKNVHRFRAAARRGRGTWITAEMEAAYVALHRIGHAHSVECWQGGELVGGLYGVAVGRVFCGESMFTRVSDASKVALVALAERLKARGYALIDCQMKTPLLEAMGAAPIPRERYLGVLRENLGTEECSRGWK